MNVGVVIARAVRRHRDRVALSSPTASLTYGEAGDRAFRLARGLLEMGLAPGDRVLDIQKNSIDYAETELALASAGLCRVALNYRQSSADWVVVARDCTPRALIYSAEFADAVAPLRDLVEHVICVDAGGGDRTLDDVRAKATAASVPLDFDASTLASLNYSSGTTGRPKGCRRTHANRLASLGNMVTDVFQGLPRTDDVWCHVAPMTHASGLFTLPHFAFGANQLILPGFDAEELLDVVPRFGVTGTVLVPTMVARLLSRPVDTAALSGLRRLVYAGAPMPEEHVRDAYHRLSTRLINMYGMVEAMPPVSILSPEEHREAIETGTDWLRSAGTVCTTVQALVRAEDGTPLPPGEIGEVFISGANVMDGYWTASAEADVKDVADGWLSTGDVGYLSEDSRLFLVNRKGDMIITGGYNVYPSEVERAIRDLPGIADVVVFGVPDAEWGQIIAAAYVARDGVTLSDDDVVAQCRATLAGYKKPRLVRRLDAFPLNSNGKVARQAVAQAVLTGA